MDGALKAMWKSGVDLRRPSSANDLPSGCKRSLFRTFTDLLAVQNASCNQNNNCRVIGVCMRGARPLASQSAKTTLNDSRRTNEPSLARDLVNNQVVCFGSSILELRSLGGQKQLAGLELPKSPHLCLLVP